MTFSFTAANYHCLRNCNLWSITGCIWNRVPYLSSCVSWWIFSKWVDLFWNQLLWNLKMVLQCHSTFLRNLICYVFKYDTTFPKAGAVSYTLLGTQHRLNMIWHFCRAQSIKFKSYHMSAFTIQLWPFVQTRLAIRYQDMIFLSRT